MCVHGLGYKHGRSRYLRLSELEEDSVLPRLPPSCAAISPHGPSWLGKREPQGGVRTSPFIPLSLAPTLTFQEGASDPTGSTHLPSPGPRASQRHPPASLGHPVPTDMTPVASPGPSPVAAHHGPLLGRMPPFCAVPAPAFALPSPSSPPSRSPSCRADSATVAARSCVGGSGAGLRPGWAARAGCRGICSRAIRAVRGRGWARGMAGGRGAPAGPA